MAFRRWFPLSLAEQAVFYENFTRVFVIYAEELGFSAEDVAALEADNAVMQFLAQTDFNLKAFKKGFQSLRDNLTKGKGVKNPVYVSFTPLAEPPIVPYGMFERLFKLSDRVTLAANYTSVIGAQLGILPRAVEPLNADELRVETLKAKSVGEAKVEVRFVRGKTNGIALYFSRFGNQSRIALGRFVKSPVIVEIPLTDGKPEQIFLSGRYLIGNDEAGDYSNLIELVVAP